MTMRSLFLPVGLIVATLVAVLLPSPGQWMRSLSAGVVDIQHLLIVMVFLIAGYRLRRKDFRFGGTFVSVLAAALVINLLLGPLAALSVAALIGASGGFFLGLMVMSCVPTTLSSGIIIVQTVRGNVVWAVSLTILLVLIGVVVLPFTLAFCLGVAADIQVPVWGLLGQVSLILLLPLGVGALIRKGVGAHSSALLDYAPSSAIILIVWMTVSRSADPLRSLGPGEVLLFALAGLSIHVALLLAGWLAKWLLRLSPADGIALVIVAAQKTLPIALTVLIALPESLLANGVLGTATVVLVIFHFIQIIFDSALVQVLHRGDARG